ncbi:AraC family transcriptional regulator [Pontivivens ytuae]|uniref:Helix-turn-helix domain-containing protein n=1 Tax=Pontivivens ytuae TaxID=2789856 RepID=A0A7S9QDX5_9RHOB|nr:helix-turn-helix transcriptional regulator [Pontivivens ytuae]QPH54606.1 helix-turn-helix domain-containing protein [Pontivivens ytuae]
MREAVFRIDTYLRGDEAYHFARKELSSQRPALRHRHDYYELFLIERGAANHWINGTEERLVAGDMVFIRPDDCHALQAEDGIGCRILNVMFLPGTADHLAARYGSELAERFFWFAGELPMVLHLTGAQMERAINTAQQLGGSRRTLARIEHFLLAIMTHVLDEVATIERSAPRWLIAACQAAQQPEVFREGAAGFVAAAGRGHEHVCRQARRHLGVSPTVFVNRIRIQHAAMLLSATGRPLADVAGDCGIENLSYFHKLFREHYGTTPGAYRERRQRDPIQSGTVTETSV